MKIVDRLGFDKVDVSSILTAHVRTLRDDRKDAPSKRDKFAQYAVPAIFSLSGVAIGARVTDASGMLGIIALLAGFLFALLILILQMATSLSAETESMDRVTTRQLRRILILRELSANVAYCVLLAIVCAVVLLLGTVSVADLGWNVVVVDVLDTPAVFSACVLWLLGHLVMTLMMVLKRLFKVTNRELDLASVRPGHE